MPRPSRWVLSWWHRLQSVCDGDTRIPVSKKEHRLKPVPLGNADDLEIGRCFSPCSDFIFRRARDSSIVTATIVATILFVLFVIADCIASRGSA